MIHMGCSSTTTALLAHVAKLKALPTFMVGGIVNQISAFSLILASLCNAADVFTDDTFTLVTLACVITLIFSGVGHIYLDPVFEVHGKKWLAWLDKRAVTSTASSHAHKGHIVVFGYNECVLAPRARRVGHDPVSSSPGRKQFTVCRRPLTAPTTLLVSRPR